MFVDIKAVYFSKPVFLGDSTRTKVRSTDHKIQYDEESQLVMMVHKKLGTQLIFREWCSIEMADAAEKEDKKPPKKGAKK